MFRPALIALVIGVQMITLPTILGNVSGIDFDPDESGFAPTTMDCDTSYENSFCLDCDDDIAVKKFWVSSNELVNADSSQIFVYGLSDGDPGISDCMKITVNEGYQYSSYQEFYPSDCFSPYRMGWHYFQFPLSCFIGDVWNYLTIEGVGTDWTKEILWIGIDTSFPTSYTVDVPDFQRSSWDHDFGNGSIISTLTVN